jgi:hypothetical protein
MVLDVYWGRRVKGYGLRNHSQPDPGLRTGVPTLYLRRYGESRSCYVRWQTWNRHSLRVIGPPHSNSETQAGYAGNYDIEFSKEG